VARFAQHTRVSQRSRLPLRPHLSDALVSRASGGSASSALGRLLLDHRAPSSGERAVSRQARSRILRLAGATMSSRMTCFWPSTRPHTGSVPVGFVHGVSCSSLRLESGVYAHL